MAAGASYDRHSQRGGGPGPSATAAQPAALRRSLNSITQSAYAPSVTLSPLIGRRIACSTGDARDNVLHTILTTWPSDAHMSPPSSLTPADVSVAETASAAAARIFSA
jgi:hypothetical protein